MEFLEGPRAKDCFLCAAGDSEKDEEHMVLYRTKSSFIIMNKYPYNTGHVMVVPKDHQGELGGLEPDERLEILNLLAKSVEALKSSMQPHAFNLGANMGEAAGAGVPGHFHFHVVPRWGGDSNFMPVLAEAKVLPETLEKTFAKLRPYFAD